MNGIRPRVAELHRLLAGATVVVLQDTRLRDERAAEVLFGTEWPGYVAYSLLHNEDGPGCSVLVRRTVGHRLTDRYTFSRHRLLVVELDLPEGRVSVASLYVPPLRAAGGAPLSSGVVERAFAGHRRTILVGDLNARTTDLGCRSSNANGDILAEVVDHLDLVVLNDPGRPTFRHVAHAFEDCLDWCLTTPSLASSLLARRGPDVGSDHWPLLVFRPAASGQPAVRPPDLPRWRTTGGGWSELFARRISKEIADRDLLPPVVPEDRVGVERLACEVEALVTAAADSCLRRSRPRGDFGRPPSPWWLRSLVLERKRLQSLLRRSPLDGEIRRELNRLRAAIRAAVREARLLRLESKARAFVAGPRDRQFWPAVRRWFRSPEVANPPLEDESGGSVFAPTDRARVLARHLERVAAVGSDPTFDADFFQDLEDDVGSDPLFRPSPAVEEQDSDEDDVDDPARPVTALMVNREIRNLRKGRAPGPDGISTDLLRAAPFGLARVLAALFSGSLSCGYVPSRWRVAWVRMLPKPGKALTAPEDFRPIALTSCLGKLLERLVARRLLLFCTDRDLLPPEQSGFRPGRDCLEQVTLIAQRAAQGLNGGLTTAVASLDVSKAYDSVWHAGLLFRCREALPPATCRWIAGFLRGRTAAVLEDGHLSAEFSVPSGVPQGSPLSPLLYVFFTASMPLPRGQRLGATAYADDVALWASAATPAAAWEVLRPHLRELVSWGCRWRLKFSVEKTQAAYFSRRLGNWGPGSLASPLFGGVELPWARDVRLLGVRLDRRLRFLRHTQEVAQRFAPRVLELRRLMDTFRRVPAWVGVLLYKSLIRSALLYAAPVLVLLCDSGWRVLERLERRALRAALHARMATPVEELYRRAAITPLREESRRLAGLFLARHARRTNSHLLASFAPEVDQRADIVRFEEPLDRLLACVSPRDRPGVVSRIHETVGDIVALPLTGGRPSRGLTHPPTFWGISPWRPLPVILEPDPD